MGYICIHGHFYQPPRENPWLEAIELQESAHPYHDWNERVDAECYAPNSTARILDDNKRIVSIVNNYAKISFNFGPTLLSWMEVHDPAVYGAIREADAESAKAFGGHGSAMAQPYNHMIMPLANGATTDPGGLGNVATSSAGLAAGRKGCGCPKPPWTSRPWRFLLG